MARQAADVVVVGAGHNGLTTAAYLARAGLRVIVVDRRERVGGACVTESPWPGFRVNTAAYVLSLFDLRIWHDLGLGARFNVQLIQRNPSSFTPLPEGGALVLGPDLDASVRSIERFSPRDARRYPDYLAQLERLAQAVEPLMHSEPPDPFRGGPLGWLAALRTGARLRVLKIPDRYAATQLLTGSAGRFLSEWFDSEPLRVTLATDAVIGAMAGPWTPGGGWLLLHHVMGRCGGRRGVWAYVRGGMGTLTEALAQAARAAGAEVLLGKAVSAVEATGSRVTAAVLEDGTEIPCRAVAFGCDVRRAVQIAGHCLDPAYVQAVERLDFRSPVCKINLALDRWPAFRGMNPNGPPPPELGGTIHLVTTLDELQQAYGESEAGAPSTKPMIELTIQSVLDPSLAPEGKHVASLFVQYVPPRWAQAPDRSALEAFADRCLQRLDEFAPGVSSTVLHRQVLGPAELQEQFGLTGGNIFHGAMSPDQLLFLRPVPGWSNYRMPLLGLYLCGSSAHPGGGVTGLPGRLAAARILADWRRLQH